MNKFLISFVFVLSASTFANCQTIKFKENPEQAKNWNIAIAKKYSSKGAVTRIDNNNNKQGVLRLTNKGLDERYLGVNFQLYGKALKSVINKPLRFKMMVKHLSGTAKLNTRMRAFKTGKKEWDYLMGSPPAFFEGEMGKWVPLELTLRIPDLPGLNMVDFQTGIRPTSDIVEYIIDNPELEVLDDTDQVDISSPLICYAFNNDSKPVEILKDGKPLAAIVTAAKPTKCVAYAVNELNHHFKRCTGVELPVFTEDKEDFDGPRIYIGKTAFTEQYGVAPDYLAPDHWLIRTAGSNLIISGGDNQENLNPESKIRAPFGSLYAVYEFLERFMGVRWYWPGKLGTVTPIKRNLVLENINIQGAPSYKARFCFYAVPNDPTFAPKETWKWWRRQRWGGSGGSPIGMHSFNSWPKRFGKTNPDYFAVQTDGKPLNKTTHWGGHVCMSNPDVLKQTIKDKTDYFKKNTWKKYSAVMPGDSNNLFYCRCPECQAKINLKAGERGRYSNAVWSFVNKVAEGVYKTSPGRYITCCAYAYYLEVPDFSLMPNVAVTLCMGHRGIPNNIYKPEGKKEYLEIINSWQKTGASLYVWDYWDAPRRYKGVYGAPTIFPNAIKEYLMLDYGKVDGHVIELCEIDSQGVQGTSWTEWVYDSLNIYVAMRLLWDMDTNVDDVLNDFYKKFYGDGGPWVKKFYTEMEAAYENPNTKGGPDFKWYWETVWVKTYPHEFVKKVMGYLRHAVDVTKGKEPYHARALKTLQGFIPFERNSMKFAGIKGDAEKILEVPPAVKSPIIDGKSDDECWKTSIKTSQFTDSFKMYDLKSGTNAKLLYDDKYLYLFFTSAFPKESQLRTELPDKSRDRFVWTDESCEFFLVQGKKKYQFLISPDGSLLDIYQPDLTQKFKLEKILKWNCKGIQYATSVNDGIWTAELAVPLASLELEKPTKTNPWKVNFTRNYYYLSDKHNWQNELSCWSPTFGSFHNVERFGKLYFKKQP